MNEVFRVGDTFSALVEVELFALDTSRGIRRSLAGGFEVDPAELASVVSAEVLTAELNRQLRFRGEDALLRLASARLVRSRLDYVAKSSGDIRGVAVVEMSGEVSDNALPIAWAVLLVVAALATSYAFGRASGSGLQVGDVVTTSLQRVGGAVGGAVGAAIQPILPIALALVVLVIVWRSS
jgi:hypothetical protein